MTEKRFTLENGNLSNVRCNILDYGYGYTNKGLCDLLNELSEENEQLKNICKNLINEINKRGITVTMSDSYKELLE